MTDSRADQYAVTQARVTTGPHRDHGGWWCDQGQPVCICGATLTPEGEAA